MFEIGDKAPDLTMVGSNSKELKLSDYRDKIKVLYFYSKDMTSGCSLEATDFRDHYPDFEENETIVIGVSKDSMTSHTKFIEKFDLPFVLVSDSDLEIIKAFGVWKEKNMYGKKTMGVERTTFIIDKEGSIRKIYSKVRVKGHVEKVLKDLIKLTENND